MSVACFHLEPLRQSDHSSGGVLPSVMCLIECDLEISTVRMPSTTWAVEQ